MSGSSVDLTKLSKHRAGAQIGETVLLVALIAAVSLGMWLILGRTGERIATQMCVNIAAVVALSVFTGNSGIVSFGHSAFMAIGAYTAGLLTMPATLQKMAVPLLPAFMAGHELSFALALVGVVIVGLAVAFASGLPIARLNGASATIATLGLLIIVHSVLIGAREITRGSQTFYGVPRVTGFWVALAAAIVFAILARLFRESRWGLELRAVRDNESAAEALGINAQRARLVGWTVSGALAAVAGALYGHMLGAFSPHTFYFGLMFAMVAMLIVGGMATVSGAVVGVVVVTILQDTVRQFEGGFAVGGFQMPAVFGLTTVALSVAILLVIWLRPEGLLGRRELRVPGLGGLFAAFGPKAAPAPPVAVREAVPLDVAGISRSFAGLKAVDSATFDVPPATVTGLIGPNGAGKSTLVNLLTGQFRADEGRARFGETDITALSPHAIAKLGLSRTFQNLRLFANLTVFENVLVAALPHAPNRAAARARALREIEALNLGAEAGTFADALPYGARKRLEIARCLAMEPAMILLDEPAAGMNPEETSDLADRLVALTEARGIGLLLIDHDLEFVNRLSSSIVVINRGAVIARGTPEEIRHDDAVIEAYIGRGRKTETKGAMA
ncbi:branched-chain amino acid ABC transporter ATP-binding protein/permease [Acuticoccus sp. MNP-M23]|uniref:branched-chain amino acid ABC transporter ATP-binding protein/permease n=1 Tax=Acuticoccus sp. MNP-M23 TaxID=3072793 RepID=UPI0028163FE8|nr:branched-chain amino acid ABC transporter ATP-binding protein/permease [Acuticoccus sp. MNP-M23]WMS42099.1 branched-chain amino acid ABC transporter ATP-binding protein/permease [Acuticoccus sp. MNP-M23]